ncbi:hypothetical protein [Desulfobacula sp.]|uniref:hypothetical protein n=1 Tax=Desulfobacula sp. TaxID=2593537 RepID=UPI0039B8B040|nr:hypothetical protein [Desulfobacula sp.]
MNKDIRLATSFKGHRKRKRLRRFLGDRSDSYLIDLWLTVAMDCPEGVLPGWDQMDIADACGWEGDPEELVSALIESSWLEKDSDGNYIIHDWCEHQGWACNAKSRSEAASKNILLRWVLRETKKENIPDVKKWFKSEYAYQKGHTTNDILSYYESYTNGNTPSPSPLPLPLPSPKDNNADSDESASRSSKKIYTTKSGKKLTGKRLETFNQFWSAFDYKHGKAPAADSWLKIPSLTEAMVKEIIAAAKIEASRRPALIKTEGSPKWAQGWLTERRWEDEAYYEDLKIIPMKKTMVYEVTDGS